MIKVNLNLDKAQNINRIYSRVEGKYMLYSIAEPMQLH